MSLFYEYERYEKEINNDFGTNSWQGIELAKRIYSNSDISIFYGSQKGGLVCANGVCGVYPGFKDGIKINLRLNYDVNF